MEEPRRPAPIDWRKTIRFALWLLSPVILIGIYLLGVEILATVAFRNFGE